MKMFFSIMVPFTLLYYLGVSFVIWNLDVSEWHVATRGFLVFVVTLVAGATAGVSASRSQE